MNLVWRGWTANLAILHFVSQKRQTIFWTQTPTEWQWIRIGYYAIEKQGEDHWLVQWDAASGQSMRSTSFLSFGESRGLKPHGISLMNNMQTRQVFPLTSLPAKWRVSYNHLDGFVQRLKRGVLFYFDLQLSMPFQPNPAIEKSSASCRMGVGKDSNWR